MGNNNDYWIVSLFKKGTVKSYRVHRLVANAFIPNPENKPQVNHIDGNKKNNKVENLEWCTASENTHHAYKTGLVCKKGFNSVGVKLTKKEILEIKTLLKENKLSQRKIAVIYNVTSMTISNIKRGKTWADIY